MTEQRVIVIPRVPSRRLAPGARFRSFKVREDREVWRQAWERVTALTDDGWTLDRVEVDWGRTLPLLPDHLTPWLVELCGDVPVSWVWSGRGRGETSAYLSKQD